MVAGGQITADQWAYPACSGDTTQNVRTTSGNDTSSTSVSQLQYLNADTRFVTINIGGNDLGFADVLANCMRTVRFDGAYTYLRGTAARCNTAKSNAVAVFNDTGATGAKARLVTLYREILRRAPAARLTILTYPTIFPTKYTPTQAGSDKYCITAGDSSGFFGLTVGDVAQFRSVETGLNKLTASIVETMGAQGLSGRISVVRLDQGDLATHTVTYPGAPPAAHTVARAVARATSMRRSSTASTASMARHAVAWEATRPNSVSWFRSTASLDRQSAPSAMATAMWVSTTPGSWVCQEIPHSSIATDSASVSPDRSASSASNPVPAWDTRPSPSVVTLARRTD